MAASVPEPSGHRDAVFGLACRDGRTLLVRNPRVTAGGHTSLWDLPGGGVEPGEDLPNALRREWREETSTVCDVGALLFVMDGTKRTRANVLLYTWRAFFFAVRCDAEPTPGEGIDEAVWVPDAEVSERLTAPYHAALRRWLADPSSTYDRVTWIDDVPEDVSDDATAARLPRRLLIIAALAAAGARSLLAREVEAALAAGEASARIVETLLQIVPYAGYPRAITAFGTVRAALGATATSLAEAEDRAARGREVFGEVYGETAGAVLRGLEALDPMLARWTIEHAYGRVLARAGVLSLRERELLAVSVLTALGGLDEPLLGHMRAALRVGATPAEVAGAVAVVPNALGEQRKADARVLLGRL
jgi:alkylhydroperoxidase/carboxymuconolactone decarboxylase family protein YurZ/ADP-ribose pyrophosphatase YjhB (NUDIX family)